MLGSNKPKVPILYRVRTDQVWEDVVHIWKEKITIPAGKCKNITMLSS